VVDRDMSIEKSETGRSEIGSVASWQPGTHGTVFVKERSSLPGGRQGIAHDEARQVVPNWCSTIDG
jgi:hypothetical protein